MTADGTNSFVLGWDEVAVIDPGPAIPEHLDAIAAAVGGRRVRAVLVTHAHLDHSPGAAPLAARFGAPVMAFGPPEAGRSPVMQSLGSLGGGEGVDAGFAPDIALAHDEELTGEGWTLRALHTPGHMASHLSFEWIEARAVFTGDVVMGWASTMISPPDGDLGQFMASLDRLEATRAQTFHPGHGATVNAPIDRCRALRAHRLAREAALLAALDDAHTIPALLARVYADTPPALLGAAARNVLAHLIALWEASLIEADPAPGLDASWRPLR